MWNVVIQEFLLPVIKTHFRGAVHSGDIFIFWILLLVKIGKLFLCVSSASVQPLHSSLHQWRSGSVLKSGRREVPCSIPGRVCWPNRSKFSTVSLLNSRKYGLESFRMTQTEDTPPKGPGITSGQLALKHTTQLCTHIESKWSSCWPHPI